MMIYRFYFFKMRGSIVYSGNKYKNLIQIKKKLIFGKLMSKKSTNSATESNLLSFMSRVHFWEKGEMAYSALRKINEHKANNELEKAQIMLDDWIL